MLGITQLFRRLIDTVSTPVPSASSRAHVFVQHQRVAATIMTSRFFLLEDLTPVHHRRITAKLSQIDEIVQETAGLPGIRFHPKYLAVSWMLPADYFEQVCRQVEIQADVIDALREVFNWPQHVGISNFNPDPHIAREEKFQVRRQTGVVWHR